MLRYWRQGKLVILLLIAAEFALLKCHIFLSKGRGGILKFTFTMNYLVMTVRIQRNSSSTVENDIW